MQLKKRLGEEMDRQDFWLVVATMSMMVLGFEVILFAGSVPIGYVLLMNLAPVISGLLVLAVFGKPKEHRDV